MQRSMIAMMLPVLASAQITISTVESVTKELRPDVLRGGIHVEEHDKHADTIKEHFNRILVEMKRFDPKSEWCNGGGYHLFPRYSYQDQKQTFLGYGGNMEVECEFQTIEQYNGFNAAIESVLHRNVRKTQSPLSWGVSEAVRIKSKLDLRGRLLKEAQHHADQFSKALSMQCVIGSVVFEGADHSPQPFMMKAEMADTVRTESPIVRNEVTVLNATVGYVCQ